MRVAYPLIIESYDYSRLQLHLEGVNTKLSDIDLFSDMREQIVKVGLKYEFSTPSYFRTNSYIDRVGSMI